MTAENPIQVIEGQVIPASGAVYRRKPTLTTARGLRKELAAVYLEYRRGEIDAKQANTSAFLIRTMAECLRLDEIERRVEALETLKQ